jgi:hypothetical protein
MGSPFFYRARVETKKGQELIPVFAFKSGFATPEWPNEKVATLEDLKRLTLMADGARVLTICTYTYLVPRTFSIKDISYFELAVHDANDTKSAPTLARRIIALISCRDMDVAHKATVNQKITNMTSESVQGLLNGQLTAVALDFHNYDGGLTFTKTI